jgi:hypothetical protein
MTTVVEFPKFRHTDSCIADMPFHRGCICGVSAAMKAQLPDARANKIYLIAAVVNDRLTDDEIRQLIELIEPPH